ncbi:MAG: nuclear transport factor 2 family protein [Variovorax sp.]|nr:MAG: nuclear transport factor 2 family protein [Variovorax sp.]
MSALILSERVEAYFAAVDRKDVAAALSFFTPDATFGIATFDILHRGRDTELAEMFERLFARYAQIWHGDFDHVLQPPDRIATRFNVRNVTREGATHSKRNANFFRFEGALFSEVFVYMSGDNSLA